MWFVKLLRLRLLLWNNKPKREKGKKRKEKPLSLSLSLSLFLSINYACEKFLFLLPNLISQRDTHTVSLSLFLYLEFSRGLFFRALILLCFFVHVSFDFQHRSIVFKHSLWLLLFIFWSISLFLCSIVLSEPNCCCLFRERALL